MKNNKKVTLIILIVLGLLFSIVGFFNASSAAESTISMFEKVYTGTMALPEGLMRVNLWKTILSVFSVATGVINLVLLILFGTVNLVKNKNLIRGLLIGNIVVSIFASDLILILAVIELILFTSKNSFENGNNEESDSLKSKTGQKIDEKVRKLKLLKVEKKDYILAVILIISYFVLMFTDISFDDNVLSFLYVILVYIFLFLLSIFTFRKTLKRDIDEFNKDFKNYFKFSLKYWGLMLLTMFIINLVKMMITGEATSGNQAVLDSLPLWYVIPLAVIWAPIVEECVFRGTVRRFIKKDTIFIIVSGLVFGLIHTVTSESQLLPFILNTISYGTMGAFMAYSYTKTNNICSNMMIHLLQNSMGAILMILMSLF